MNKTKKLAISVSSIVIALAIILFVVKLFNNNSSRNQIPSLPDFTTVSAPVKEQLSLANETAFDRPTADNIGALGMAYHSSAIYDKATQCYKLAIGKDKSKWRWNYLLGYLNQEMGDSKSAIENFNSVIKENPKVLQAWYYLGKAYQNLALDDLAEEAFNKIAYLNEDISKVRSVRINYSSLQLSAKFELARMYMNTKRLDKAEKLLKEVIKNNHTVGPIYRLLGNVYSAKGDSASSKKYIIRAQDLADVTSVNDTIIDKLALISRSDRYLPKQIDEAMKSFNREWAIQLFYHALLYLPDNKYLISKAIKSFLMMNKGEEILPYLEKNLNDFKDDLIEIKSVADLLFNNKFYSQAAKYYSRMNKLKPESNEQLVNFAMCYWNQSKKDSALNMMNEQFEKHRNNPTVLASEVEFMLNTGDKDKAKTYLTKLRQAAPSDPKYFKFSGMIAESEGNLNAAIQMYQAAFKGDPTDLETIKNLGNLLLEQKQWISAINFAKISLKYHPNTYFLLERLGTFFISCPDQKLRNVQEGMELSGRAFYNISSPPSTVVYAGKSLAQGYAMTGDFPTATYYVNISISMAKNVNMSKDYLQGLINLADKIKQYSKQQ
jgi:tetratricopeptide (TPR) repeat protein